MSSKGKRTNEAVDRATFFKLIAALKAAGIPNARKVAELVAALINTKIAHSEGRHFAKHHALPADWVP